MQIAGRFTVALHLFVCFDTFKGEYKLTGKFLADNVNVNPAVIRRLSQQLKAAGLIRVTRRERWL
ncbi:MAG: Rrf2 family transcriptional regulator [Eubacteriales bacterium]|nr:Rrf2 family transcriptional regulator [Eubacteriales bacterium]